MAEAAQKLVSQKQKVTVTNSHGEKLVGLLHEAGSRELVIMCHGALESKVLEEIDYLGFEQPLPFISVLFSGSDFGEPKLYES